MAGVLEVFFFQAEDGIRDGRVTGVMTCALPISRVAPVLQRGDHAGPNGRVDGLDRRVQVGGERVRLGRLVDVDADDLLGAALDPGRSEERRVGKESRRRESLEPAENTKKINVM